MLVLCCSRDENNMGGMGMYNMRGQKLLLMMVLCFLVSACRSHRCCNECIVCETYVHPYGIEMSEGEWCRQGASGDVIVKRLDGVTVKSSYQSGDLDGEVTHSFPFRDSAEHSEMYSKGSLVKEVHYFPSGVVQLEIEHISPTERVVKANYDQGTRQAEETYVGDKLQKGTYYNLKEVVESSVDDFSGKSTKRDVYGQLLSVDTVEEGQIVLSTTYHPNGMPHAITPYQDGVIDGQLKTYLPGGEPYSVEEWHQGTRNGLTTVYQDGEKIAEIPYANGRKNGIEKHFRNNDEVVEEISWVEDVEHGPRVRYVEGQAYSEWYFNGAPVSKAVYDKRTALIQRPGKN